MSKLHLYMLLIPALLLSAATITGCAPKPAEVIMAVPLCDCNEIPDDPQADCWEGYVCKRGASCSKDGGLYDKCVPADSLPPQGQSPSY